MTKFILTIKTDSYAGNFDRDLAAYCFGWYSEFISEEFHKAFEAEEGDIDLNLLNFHDEHGDTCFEITEKNTLLVYFSQNPQKHLDLIKRRLLAFPKIHAKYHQFTRLIKIKSISLTEEVTSEKLILEEIL